MINEWLAPSLLASSMARFSFPCGQLDDRSFAPQIARDHPRRKRRSPEER